ncbi:hypothetical protein [Streptomyces sp. NPDC051921]|uniref:hypothetical protein n=1 Tax=Streptomyces sp. NPDC051921 TaxID=3155806 RepID=UPI003415337F
MGLLSWLRGGRGNDAAAEAARPAGLGERGGPDRADRVDLAELPPIQRTLGAPALVTDPSAFERGLPTRRPTALTSPLGHLVSAEAPSGLVEGVAAPVSAPVQRSVTGFPARTPVAPSPATPPSSVPSSRDAPPGAVSAPRPAELPGAAVPEAVPASAASSERNAVGLPVGERAVQRAAGPPSVRAQGPAAQSASAPGAAPYDPAAPSAANAEGRDAPVRPLVGDQPPLLDAPEPAEPTAAPQSPPPAVQRALPPTPPRRRPGLGAPLPGLPPTAQREAAGAVTPPVREERAAPRHDEEVPPVAPAPPPAPEPEPAPEPVVPLIGDRPLELRTVTADAATGAAGAAGDGGGTGPSAAPAPAAVQRGLPGAAPVGPPAAPSVPTVPVRWETPVAQRRAEGVPTVPLRRTPTGTAVAPPVQRAVRRTPPASAAPRPAAPRDAGDVAVAAGIAQRMADGSVVFAPPPVQRSVAASVPFVQREVADEEPPPPEPVPSPEPDGGSGADGHGGDGHPAGADVGGPAAVAASGSPHPAGTPGTPAVTDEFVRALYPPLARLLKADLRLERERAGRLINTRF